MSFLKVIELKTDNKVLKLYRNSRAGRLTSEQAAKNYVEEIIEKYPELFNSMKQVIILWQNEGKRMADAWIFGENESDEEGAQVSVYLFEELARYESPIVTAVDGLQVLAEEAKESLKKN